ncbi:glycosyltransferase family 2 protein [Microcella sp.]|uniref:glycosyltransferase family 2 protein n=1 Tax=Microcella sp. TaxID=1913979 RepID=UPI002560DB28|nr:glycosyltransferase family 2 protein [Microcella sp.]MBX9472710.1 glycosyltransferase family 2 protein [Microcella sp.]
MTGGDVQSNAQAGEPGTARVAVVTVAYRSNEVLPGFLASIAGASSELVHTVVVDNRPDADSRAEELAAEIGAAYVAQPNNPGYGGAINAGVATLPDEVHWVLVSNPDVVLHPGVIDALVAVGESDDRIGAIGPAVLNPDGTVYPSARRVPSLRTGVGHALFVNLWHDNPWTRRYRADDEAVAARDAGWLSGACLLVRRTAFDELGGFDEHYFMYFEDVDLGYRLGKAGYRNRFEPGAAVTHVGAHTTASDSSVMIRAHHDSARRFISRKYAGWHLWPVRAALGVGLSVRSAVLARGSR